MTDNKEALAKQIANKIVGVEHWTDDNRIAVVERVNSSHPHLEIGLFVDYRMSPDSEWITPEELKRRLDSGKWTVRDGDE